MIPFIKGKFLIPHILMAGYELQRNEPMIDRVLQDCVKYSVQPDMVLLNGAIDAYVRYYYPTFRNSVPQS